MDNEKKDPPLLPPPSAPARGGSAPEVAGAAGELQAEIERLRRTVRELERKVGRDRETVALWQEFQPKFTDFLVEMLEVLDNFERAEEAAQSDSPAHAIAEGLSAVRRQMLTALERRDIRAFAAPGDEFHPALHHVLGPIDHAMEPPLRVTEVLRPGYKIGEQVLRKAWVQVEQQQQP